MKWSINNNVKEVLILEGIPVQAIISSNSNRQPVILSSSFSTSYDNNGTIQKDTSSDSLNNDNNQQQQGNTSTNIQKYFRQNTFIGSISEGLLLGCLYNEIPCTALIIPASSGIPDPEGAAAIIESISRIIDNSDLNINARQLREQGTELKTHGRVNQISQGTTTGLQGEQQLINENLRQCLYVCIN
jgi:uncharacterized protein